MTETSPVAHSTTKPVEDIPARPTMRRRAPEPQHPPSRHHLDRRADEIIEHGEGDDDELLSTSDVAEWLQLSVQWVEIGRHRGYGPKFIRLSPRRVRYRRGDVRDWLRQRQHQATAEYSK